MTQKYFLKDIDNSLPALCNSITVIIEELSRERKGSHVFDFKMLDIVS